MGFVEVRRGESGGKRKVSRFEVGMGMEANGEYFGIFSIDGWPDCY